MVKFNLRMTQSEETEKNSGRTVPAGVWLGTAKNENGIELYVMTQGTEFEHEGKGVELLVNFWTESGWDPYLIREENATFVTSVSAQTDAEKVKFPYFAGGLSPNERDHLIREYLERRAKWASPKQGAKLFVK